VCSATAGLGLRFPGAFRLRHHVLRLSTAMPQKRRIRPSILLAFHAQVGNTVHIKDHATYVDYSINKENVKRIIPCIFRKGKSRAKVSMTASKTKGNHAKSEPRGNYSIIPNRTRRDREQYEKKSQGKLMVEG
jgi:hypothetical protein